MFILTDTTVLGTDARELVEAADSMIQDHFGSLLPKNRTALHQSLTGEESHEIAAHEFLDHFIEFSTLFPQLPDEVVTVLAQCTRQAVDVPVMRHWISKELAEEVKTSIVAEIRHVADKHDLSDAQAEILKAIVTRIEGFCQEETSTSA